MMVNVKLSKEMRKNVIIMSRAWDKGKKKTESPTQIEPMAFRTLVGCFNH